MAWQDITIGEALRRTARGCPDRVFLAGGESRLGFGEVDRRVDAFAAGLIELGIGRGDNVAIWMTNSVEWVLTWMACARIGATLVPINTRYKTEEARFILRQSEAKALVFMERFWDIDYLAMIDAMVPDRRQQQPGRMRLADLPALTTLISWGERPPSGCLTIDEVGRRVGDRTRLAAAAALVEPGDTAIIVYTSGTTGHPKGAMHSHRVLRQSANTARAMRMVPGDKVLGHMPFYHVAGAFTQVLPSVLLGCTLIIMPTWEPEAALRLIAAERINYFSGIPTHFIDCLDVLKHSSYDTRSLKSGWIGGAPVTADVAEAAIRKLGMDALQAVYGMTETQAVTVLSDYDAPLALVCDNKGKPIGEYEVRVVDPATGSPRPVGQAGEVWVRGHIVMQGYYKNPEATRECLSADGWFRTGDLGVFDDDGNLKITGRAKEMFIVGGSNAYPAEIEQYLQSHPAIKQAVVVGVPDRRLGEVGHAVVQLHDGETLTAEEVVAFCRRGLADYKVPRGVAFVVDFPRTPTGKIQRYLVAESAHAVAGAPSPAV